MTNAWEPTRSEDDADLRRYLQVVWRRKWILVVCLLVVPISAYLISSQATETYEASATIQVEPTGADPAIDLGSTTRALAAATRLAETADVAREAAGRLSPEPSVRELQNSIELATDTEAGFLTVTAASAEAQRASDTANAYADAVQAVRTERAQDLIDVSIEETRRSTRRSRDDTGSDEESASLGELRIARAEQKNRTQVIEPAVTPNDPAAPQPVRAAILALVVALIIGLGVIFILDAFDRQLREPDEVERLLGSSLLGTVPVSAIAATHRAGHVHEAFQMLRATLTYFNVEPLRSVLITSPVGGDGKTTMATNLAIGFARSGKTVVLVDADLRRPQVGARLLGDPHGKGLGSLIAGQIELSHALRDVDIGGGNLKILPAGPPPPNPSELLGSERMRHLLNQLTEVADLVILDSAPALVVSDSIPLLNQVSGIVVAARVDHTPRKALTQLARVLTGVRAKVLGVVVNGVRDEVGYGYDYAPTAGADANGEALPAGAPFRAQAADATPVSVPASKAPGGGGNGLGS